MKAKLPIAALLVLSMASAGVFALELNEAPDQLLAQSSEDTAASESSSSGNGASTKSVTIGEGDTLWSLAARLRPGEDIAIQQMILALVDANPSVFPGGDLNRMRTGQRLTVPSREAIETRTAAEAKRQYQALSQPSQARSEPTQESDTQDKASESATETTNIAGTEESPARVAPEDVEAPQETAPNVDVSGANVLQASVDSSASAEKKKIETPQLVDRRLAALALEKERQADQDELEVLRNRNQSMRDQLAQQQQELIELEEQSSAANARAQQAEQEAQQASTPGWQTWGWILNAVLLVLILGGLLLYKRRRSRQGEAVASGSHRRDNEPSI